MNRIKARTTDGKSVLLSVKQKPAPEWLGKDGHMHGGEWPNSPKAVKARAFRAGLVLVGKRQSFATLSA